MRTQLNNNLLYKLSSQDESITYVIHWDLNLIYKCQDDLWKQELLLGKQKSNPKITRV